ncbi:MAG TPA: GMP reductase, partial [Balneola sp.]|nr:GMP reductase [Balneola sp.]
FVKFYGMSSLTANEKHSGGLKNYRAAEGKEVLVKYKGPLQNTIDDLLGGIRSACTYVNAIKLTKIQRNAKFVLVNNQVNTVFGNE